MANRDSFPIVPSYAGPASTVQANADAVGRAIESLCHSVPRDHAAYAEIISLLDSQKQQVIEYFWDLQI
jgi:hypothetical protein